MVYWYNKFTERKHKAAIFTYYNEGRVYEIFDLYMCMDYVTFYMKK